MGIGCCGLYSAKASRSCDFEPPAATRSFTMHGSSSHSSNNVGVTSRWNCRPSAEPNRNAWFLRLRAFGQRLCAFRQGHHVVVPVQHVQRLVPHGEVVVLVDAFNRREPDFRRIARFEFRAQRGGNDAMSEAHAQQRFADADGGAYSLDSALRPGYLSVSSAPMGPPIITIPETSLKSGRSGFFSLAMFITSYDMPKSSRLSKMRGFSHGTC